MDKPYTGGRVTLSFDDGWRCVYDNALPILETARVPSTHYIISGCLDDEQFPRYMNLSHVRDLESRGHEIGCHTASHKHLLEETLSIVKEEIILSKKFLEKSGLAIQTFAYPYGEYSDQIIEIIKEAGFTGARSVLRGFNTEHTDPFLLQCQEVKVSSALDEVRHWLGHAQQTNTWLILVFHQIDTELRERSSTPAMLSNVVTAISDMHVPVITINQGLLLAANGSPRCERQ